MSYPEFEPFTKIARWSRGVVITEKIDGTNAGIWVNETGTELLAASRSKWLLPGEPDNFGFRAWVEARRQELLRLGPGLHFGEWWGSGIQRSYGLKEKRFSLFNVSRWTVQTAPAGCSVVPVLWSGSADDLHDAVSSILARLRAEGSVAAPGFARPEGIIIYHTASRTLFKKTLEKDDQPKSKEA
jgi:hypothetical protein